MGAAFRSCVAMMAALPIGLVYGAVVELYAPVSEQSFLVVGGISIALLFGGSFHRRTADEPTGSGGVRPGLCVGLAGFASLLVVVDAFSGVARASLPLQVLLALPFLLAIGHAVRCRAWLAASGAAGFFATAVAMLYCNSGGGWAGFFSVYCA